MNRRYYGLAKNIKGGYRDQRTQRLHEKQIVRDEDLHKRKEEKAIRKEKNNGQRNDH